MLRKPITINNPQSGLAPSAFLGFAEIRGLNITDKPGVCFPNYATQNDDSSENITGRIDGWVETPSGTIFCYNGENKKLYIRSAVNSYTEKSGHGTGVAIDHIFYFKGHIGLVQGDDIAWYEDDGTYVNTWSNVLSGTVYKSFTGADDKLYLFSALEVNRLTEDTNFDPATGSTYTLEGNGSELKTHPEGLGSPLDVFEIGNFAYIIFKNDIFVWDHLNESPAYESFVKTPKPIQQAVLYNKTIYLQMGYKGEWYVTNGVQFTRVAKLPPSLFTSRNIYTYKGCVHDDMIYFSVGGASAYEVQGIYSFDPESDAGDTKYSPVNLEYIVRVGASYPYGTSHGLQFGPLFSLGTNSAQLCIPFTQNASHYINSINTSRYTGDNTFLVSKFYRIGYAEKGALETIEHVDIQLSKAMAAGDSVKAYYRATSSGDWSSNGVLIGTISHATDGAISYKRLKCSIRVPSVQIKCILNDEAELADLTLL